MRFSEAFAALALSLAWTLPAQATDNFPPLIASELGLEAAPDCSLCHQGAEMKGTVVTPFGTKMRSRGLMSYDEGSLKTALRALEGERADSDEDGSSDLDELRAGDDPNLAPGEKPIEPEYGCHVSSPGQPGPGLLGLAFTTLFLIALGRRGRP